MSAYPLSLSPFPPCSVLWKTLRAYSSSHKIGCRAACLVFCRRSVSATKNGTIYAITASVARPFLDTLFSWPEIPNRICHGRHIGHCYEPSNINGINEKRIVLPCHRFGPPSRIPYSIVRRLSTAPSLKAIIKYKSDEAEARGMDSGPVLLYERMMSPLATPVQFLAPWGISDFSVRRQNMFSADGHRRTAYI